MASRRIPSLLALEVESANRPSAARQRDSGVDPPHLSREPAVGRASNSIGTAPPRIRCHGKDRGEISGETCQAAIANLEDISCQSCESDCGRRFFTIPTINFRVLYCFIVLLHSRRKIVHFNVTANPTAEWTARANHRSLSGGYRSPVSTKGSRFDLWSGISKQGERDAD